MLKLKTGTLMIVTALLFSNCSKIPINELGQGAIIGAGTGAILGYIISHHGVSGTIIGFGVGGAGGTVAGDVIRRNRRESED